MRYALIFGLLAALAATPASAQDMQILGFGRLFNNDRIGDGGDKWRSGSYHLSIIRGRDWQGELPDRPFGLQEFRLRSEIIAPRGATGDRPYVGAVSAGFHTYFGLGPMGASLGGDVTAIGPQTGVSALQETFHDIFSIPDPQGTDTQLGNDFFVSGTVELNWPVRVSDAVTLRPFAEAQAGVETLARVGADVVIGPVGHDDMFVRDVVTGQPIRAIEAAPNGVGVIVGGDWAYVDSSVFLPLSEGVAPTQERYRARAGLHWQMAEDLSFFYGATYLSEEFEGQDGGQILGSLKLNFNF